MSKELILNPRQKAYLVLRDGKVFEGFAFGAIGETSGEVVFNTSMMGYQEILTDPSYVYQILTFTYPHIGNVGINLEDIESSKIHAAGIILREPPQVFSNYRATESLESYLQKNNIVGICGIDTRALVLYLREHGSQVGIVSSSSKSVDELLTKVKLKPEMEGLDLVKDVSCTTSYTWNQGSWKLGAGYKEFSNSELASRPHVVAIDCGIKFNILRKLVDSGFRVTVVPAKTSGAEILKYNPDGVFLSNGPGDPAVVTYTISAVKEILGKKPIFGICLGHQILGHALNAPTFKLKFGHRGGNHPVKDQKTGKVEITVQNHGFATDPQKVPKDVQISHINLNDNTVEGLTVSELKAFSVQYHPECSPGPHDSQYLFKNFWDLVTKNNF